MDTLIDLLEEAVAAYGQRTALARDTAQEDDTWSYQRLWRATHAVACHLRQNQALQPGQRVLVWAPNSPQLVATYFGAMLAGIPLVPLDVQSPPDLVARIARKCEPAALILDPAQASPVPGLKTIDLPELPFAAEGVHIKERPQANDIAEIVFTSGSTGDPKGVVLTHGNIMANVLALGSAIPKGPHYRLLSLLPLSHMFEQTVGLYFALSYGATIYYPPSRQASTLLKIFREQRITCLAVVPQVLELFLKAMEREARQRGRERQWRLAHRLAPYLPFSLRRLLFRDIHRSLGGRLSFFVCGGAYLPLSLAAAWERLGVKVVQGYGTTECSPGVTYNTLNRRVLASVGRPLFNLQLRLAEDGEIQVRGPNVFSGYWHDQEATRAAFTTDGWYRTGDLGALDKRGYLYLKGRKKDLIVLTSGLNVYPEDVENELKREEAIRDCVVLGLTDPSGDVEVHAVLLPSVQGAPDEVRHQIEAVLRRANARLAPHQRIKGYTLWPGEDFPRTHTLKVKRHEVLAALAKKAPSSRPTISL